MADREDRVIAALNFLTGEGIGYHPDGCDQETLALINDYFSAPKADEESGFSDSEGLAAVLIYLKSQNTSLTGRWNSKRKGEQYTDKWLFNRYR